jgi:hypothetical protein
VTDPYINSLIEWRQRLDDALRRDDGWLTLVGLFWLHEGDNRVGSDPACEVALPAGSVAPFVGTLRLQNGAVTLTAELPVIVDDEPVTTATLRADSHADGPSLVRLETVSFFVIDREGQIGVRVRDVNHPARVAFTGRPWYDIDARWRVTGRFTRHDPPRQLTIINSVGMAVPMNNPGTVTFELDGQPLRLEAFERDADSLWFIFKDATNSKTTYGAGRFMVSAVNADGSVDVDFNRAYSPPCAFTPYATCPLPPRENVLLVMIEAGERYSGA